MGGWAAKSNQMAETTIMGPMKNITKNAKPLAISYDLKSRRHAGQLSFNTIMPRYRRPPLKR